MQPILVGEIVKAHGLRGEVIISAHTQNQDRFAPGATLRVGRTADDIVEFEVVAVRSHQDRLIVSLEGIADRNAAEALRGRLIFIASDELPELEEGLWWEKDILGMSAVDQDGTALGVVTEVIVREVQDLWKIDTGRTEVFVPAVPGIVVSVDLENRTIVIDPPKGLFGS